MLIQKKRPTTDDLLAVSYKWRFLSDGKAPFIGPRSNKRVKTLTLLKSNLPSGNTQHPQAFYTSRLLHYPNLPEPKNSDTFTLFNPQTGEIHTMVRKQASKNQPSVRQSSDNSIKENLQSFSAINENEKGKERAQEPRQYRMRDAQRTNNALDGRKSRELQRSFTMDRVDNAVLDKINNRQRLPTIRWSGLIDQIPKAVEVSADTDKKTQ